MLLRMARLTFFGSEHPGLVFYKLALIFVPLFLASGRLVRVTMIRGSWFCDVLQRHEVPHVVKPAEDTEKVTTLPSNESEPAEVHQQQERLGRRKTSFFSRGIDHSHVRVVPVWAAVLLALAAATLALFTFGRLATLRTPLVFDQGCLREIIPVFSATQTTGCNVFHTVHGDYCNTVNVTTSTFREIYSEILMPEPAHYNDLQLFQ